jgi:hypothetical protein
MSYKLMQKYDFFFNQRVFFLILPQKEVQQDGQHPAGARACGR